MKEFDLKSAKAGASVQTRDGRKVRIICFDAKITDDGREVPIVVLFDRKKCEEVEFFSLDGSYLGDDEECGADLVMVTTKRECWINVYPPGSEIYDYSYPNQHQADYAASKGRVGCVRYEWED